LERSTGFTRAISIRGWGDLIPSVVGVDDERRVGSTLGGASFALGGASFASDQPDSDFGALRHSIACADEAAAQQQTSRVLTSAFMTCFENLPANLGLSAIVFRLFIAATPAQNNPECLLVTSMSSG
jgi:hypothetical protein